ncbi:nucleotidyltransferase domain-containing protein [Pyrobaculum aerophilum]|uniref:Polymerase nucleotidyl transferase domain-containing protein n=2 Tax=Pyrobaculum aerophilum TaxID=13773 RepID=Q8ZUY3_PYRAE|nr:nucleotidyltransferase domain-containing protein [Pyrobaculum aerophilum]AAL64273.1 conserved hypothetical protein [Pyrobaculum aerophilum str. IM2]MCX8137704.1 nucleotidyltransferase domain-containing protein [Pyrobaculum aerophilum]
MYFRKTLLKMHSEIETWIKRLCEQGYTVVLFGSRARGEARIDSDWDVVVIGEEAPEPPPNDLAQVHYATPNEAEALVRDFNTIFIDAFYEGKLLCGNADLYSRLKKLAEATTRGLVKTKDGWMPASLPGK